MAVKVTVTLSGPFFENPSGQLHRNIYDVLEEAAAIGADSARSQLQPGHGYLTGNLRDSIQPRLVKAGRATKFQGRARVIAGARGFEKVRRYQGKIERQFGFMSNASREIQSWVDGNRAQISAMLARKLS